MATQTRAANIVLWIAQILLAALFLFAGVFKLVAPLTNVPMPVHLPIPFLRFIGAAEVLGTVGLILPGALRVRRELTPLAAVGLVTIMSGATVITIEGGAIAPALIPLVVGAVAASIAYGRRGWAAGRSDGGARRGAVASAAA
jgi:uncharacterized membrane protein YphA (DoxX/SURF4 family)